jgi:hypothetical protein
MLEDPSFTHVVCWGPQGDCFVVKVCFVEQYLLDITLTSPSLGYERIHKINITQDVQTLQLCKFRTTIKQVRLS